MSAVTKNNILAAPIKNSAEQLDVTIAAARGISTNKKALRAIIYTETDIRYWVDYSIPTASVGLFAAAGDTLELSTIEEIAGFKCIAVSLSGKLNVEYMG